MSGTSWVKANVVDIRKSTTSLPKQVAIDANVLYFCNYAHFDQLRQVGGSTPWPYQTSAYPKWWAAALKSGAACFTSLGTLGEFVRLVEYAELEMLWITDPARESDDRFSPSVAKKARYDQVDRLPAIRQQSLAFLESLLKTVTLFPLIRSPDEEAERVCALWRDSTADYVDASLVASAVKVGVKSIVTDDIDMLSFAGLTVYTANSRAVEAASEAGQLVR